MSSLSSRGPAALVRVVAVLCLVVLVAVAAPSSWGAEITVAPSADTFVSAAEPGYNYGGAGAVEVSAPSAPNGEYQGLLRFDLAAAKAGFDAAFGAGGWRLDGASLRLSTTNPNNPIFNPNVAGPVSVVWMQNDAWVEGTGGPTTPATEGLTYATLPSFQSAADEAVGSINFAGGNSGTNAYALTLSPGFTSDVLSGGEASLRLASASASYLFSSRTFGIAANRPALVLSASAVPEPGAGALVLGCIGLMLRRRSRRS